MKLYMVGGAVRDELLGVKSKDIDFAVEAQSFDAMRHSLLEDGFEIFLETPEHFTIRARGPRSGFSFAGRELGGQTFDFVLCRREGAYSDGRHPDEVSVGTLADDLRRRDFTINAMAINSSGQLIDLFAGQSDLHAGWLRCVGSAEERLREDALRAIRALRFSITKDMSLDSELVRALDSTWLPPLMKSVSTERKREELLKCFRFNTDKTLDTLFTLSLDLRDAILSGGIWLRPTLEER